MFAALLEAPIISGVFPLVIYGLCLVALVLMVVRRPFARWGIRYAVAAAVGFGIGLVIAWWFGDVQDDFDVTLTFATRAWFSLGVAGIAVAAVSLWHARGWRIPAGIAGILLFALLGGFGVNSTVGEFPTLASAFGLDGLHQLHDPEPAKRTATTTELVRAPLWSSWQAPSDMPALGRTGIQPIAGVVSHFAARDAVVYLPPAALVKNAPALPVMIFLSGQPASPETVVEAGQLPEIMDSFAAAHHGLAPIVVIPDQLGAPQDNPMCVDSRLGHVATYLTVDVRNWILDHLKVLTARQDWTIGGFSEGGTCSIQLGTRFSSIFGNILDISGQVAPLNGSVAHTIRVGFAGSAQAYAAASPLHLLSAGAPFNSTVGVFGAGADDSKYGPQSATVEAAAARAGMVVHAFTSPGTAHDWYTVQYGLRFGVSVLAARWGLAPDAHSDSDTEFLHRSHTSSGGQGD